MLGPRRLIAATALLVASHVAPAAAETRIAGGFMLGQPIAGASGGADYALAVHAEHGLRSDLDLGVTIEAGHAPGNADESLTRLAVLPTLGVRGAVGSVVLRADVAIGWQLANGNTKIAGLPVSGTEARGVRAEMGVALETAVATRVALRARGGLALDGIYPSTVRGLTTLSPLVELALVLTL